MFKGKRFTPAMIVAMIALAVALSGTAVAGTAKLITGGQIANGTIKLADIHPGAKAALKGERGATGAQGPGRPGCPGAGRAAGRHRREGRHGCRRRLGNKGEKGDKGDAGFSPTAFGPYASDSPDSSICGNDWATDKMDRSYVVYPQVDGSFLVAQTFTNGTFTTVAGNSPQDGVRLDGGRRRRRRHRHDERILPREDPCRRRQLQSRGHVRGQVLHEGLRAGRLRDSSYDVPVFEMHYSSPGHGTWKNASDSRGGNEGNIN